MKMDRSIRFRRAERRDSEDSLASLAAEDRILLQANDRDADLTPLASQVRSALVGHSDSDEEDEHLSRDPAASKSSLV